MPVSNKLCKKPGVISGQAFAESIRETRGPIKELEWKQVPPHPTPISAGILRGWTYFWPDPTRNRSLLNSLFMPLDGDFKAAQAAIGGVCFEGVFVRRHPWYYMLAQISFAG